MDFLKTWIQTIIIIIIFAAFIDILMPSTSVKKYVKFVLGLIIMTVILNPMLKLFDRGFSISENSFKMQEKLDSIYVKKQAEYYSEKQSDIVTKVYKQNLEDQIKQLIKNDIKDREVKVNVEVYEDTKSEDYGKIKKVDVELGKQTETVARVDKVKIGEDAKENQNSKKPIYKEEDLKNKISSIYGIDKGMIEINILN